MKVLKLCLLLIDISASLKILANISEIIITKKYDMISLIVFHLALSSLWYSRMHR